MPTASHSTSSLPTYQFQPISLFHSCFKQKTGTPRQFNLIPHSRGYFHLDSHHLIAGLEVGTYLHVIWLFHENFHIKEARQKQKDSSRNEDQDPTTTTSETHQEEAPILITNQMQKKKIKPPRMNGEKIGIFAARSPYRPNPFGLSVCKIREICIQKDDSVLVHLEGCDLVDGTPIVDIKPYITQYDSIPEAPVPTWFQNVTLKQRNVNRVSFTEEAEQQLQDLVPKMEFYTNDHAAVRQVIEEMLLLDPRSKYRREKCQEEVFGFCIDNINVRCIFQQENECVVCEVESVDTVEKMDRGSLKRRNTEDYARFVKRLKLSPEALEGESGR